MKLTKSLPWARASWLATIGLVMALGSSVGTSAQQAQGVNQPAAVPVQATPSPDDSHGPAEADGKSNGGARDAGEVSSAQELPQSDGTSGVPETESGQPHNKPVGTAAAPAETTMGVTASRPAGAVIAPAKQRRVKAILIRVGLIVGAAVALGTVLVLTHATPSRPQ